MPLQRRVPKFGFRNINRTEYRAINLDTVQELMSQKKVKKEISIEQFIELRLAHKNDLVKILGRGKLDSPIKITAHKFSASAKAAIEAAGFEVGVRSRLCWTFSGRCEMTLYPSGKLMIRTEDKGLAEDVAQSHVNEWVKS